MENKTLNYYGVASAQCFGVCLLHIFLLPFWILGKSIPWIYNNSLIRRLKRIPFFPPKDCKFIQKLNEANTNSNKTGASSIWSESEADIPDNYTDMLDGTYIDIYDETMTPMTKEDILKRSMPKSRK